MGERVKLTEKNLALLKAINREGQIASSMANPPVMGLVKCGLVRFRYRSEDLNIMELTDVGRAALKENDRG